MILVFINWITAANWLQGSMKLQTPLSNKHQFVPTHDFTWTFKACYMHSGTTSESIFEQVSSETGLLERTESKWLTLPILTHSNSERFCLAHAQYCTPCGVLLKGWGQQIREQQTQMLMREARLHGRRTVSENATAGNYFPSIGSEERNLCLIE